MKPKCRHQFQRSSERQGDRYVTTFHCPLCKKTVKRSRKIKTKEAKPRQRMRTRSLKRQKEESEYNRERVLFLESRPICQRCGQRRSNQVHHLAGREGIWLLLQEFWRAVCGECHDWIENNRAAAKSSGWLLTRKPSK